MRGVVAMMAAAALLAAGIAEARPKETPVATPIGPAISCVRLHEVRETRVRDNRTIDFFLYGGQVYRNALPLDCPDLGFEESFSYVSQNEQLCSVDQITVFRHGSPLPGVTCGLGHFQPVRLADARGVGGTSSAAETPRRR